MKLNRTVLLEATEAALAEHKRVHDERTVRYQEWLKDSRAEWLDTYTAAWKEACTAIREALRKNRPVTRDMLPESKTSTNVPLYSASDHYRSPQNPGEYQAPDSILAMRALLSAAAEDEVTTSVLERFGFRDLHSVLRFVPAQKAAS